jgi:2-dehydropantoate 2-reductase
MRTAIYGAGAMGTVLGAYISKSGQDIQLITRNKAHVEALNSNGAHIIGTVDFTVKVNAILPEQMSGKYDVIFLMTKQRDNAQIAKFLLPYLNEGGVICTTQNGLPEPDLALILGEENTIGCAISWGATYVGAGVAKLTSSPDKLTFALGSTFGANKKVERVAPLLSLMGNVTVEQNFIGARWSKLLVNSAFSSLSAVTGLTFGEVANGKTSRKLAQAILKEGMDVAASSNITPAKIQGHDIVKLLGYKTKLKKWLSYKLIPLAMKGHKDIISGMYYDLKSGRLCDIDYVCGVIAKYGKQCGVKTPVSNSVISLAHSIERGENNVDKANITVLYNSLKGII